MMPFLYYNIVIKILISILLVFVAVIYYFYIKNILKYLRENDSWFHLYCAKEIKYNKGLLKYYEKFYPGKKVLYTYPPFLHIILAILVDRVPLKVLLLWPVIMNFILGTFLFGLTIYLKYPLEESLLCSFLFLLIPSNIKGNLSITPRQLGILFYSLAVVFASLSLENWSLTTFIISAFFLGLLLITHRMGSQLIFICSITSFIFFIFYIPKIALFIPLWALLGYSVAYAISGGFYNVVLLDHIRRLKIHFIYGPQHGGKKQLGNPVKIVAMNPSLLFTLFYTISFPCQYNLDKFLIVYIIVLITIFSVCIFWIWGSGARHIIFAAPVSTLFLLHILMKSNQQLFILFIITVLVNIFFSCFYSYVNLKSYGSIITEETIQAYSFLNEISESKLVAILPDISCPSFLYFVNKKLFAYPHDSGAMWFNRLSLKYRLNNTAYIANLFIDNKVDIIMVKRNYNIDQLIETMHFNKVFENNIWFIFARSSNNC